MRHLKYLLPAKRGSTLYRDWGKPLFPLSLTLELQQETRRRPCPPLSLVQLSAVRDRDPLGASPRPRTESLHFLDHVHSLLHAAKDNMLAIQPKRRQQEVYYHGPGLRDDPSCTQLGGTLGSRRHYSCNALLGRHWNPFYLLLLCQSIRRIYSKKGWKKKNWNSILTTTGQ